MPQSVLYKASQAGSGTSRQAVLLSGQAQRQQKPVAGFGETDFFFSEDKVSNGKEINPEDSRGLRRQLDGLDGYKGLGWSSGNNQKSTSQNLTSRGVTAIQGGSCGGGVGGTG